MHWRRSSESSLLCVTVLSPSTKSLKTHHHSPLLIPSIELKTTTISLLSLLISDSYSSSSFAGDSAGIWGHPSTSGAGSVNLNDPNLGVNCGVPADFVSKLNEKLEFDNWFLESNFSRELGQFFLLFASRSVSGSFLSPAELAVETGGSAPETEFSPGIEQVVAGISSVLRSAIYWAEEIRVRCWVCENKFFLLRHWMFFYGRFGNYHCVFGLVFHSKEC